MQKYLQGSRKLRYKRLKLKYRSCLHQIFRAGLEFFLVPFSYLDLKRNLQFHSFLINKMCLSAVFPEIINFILHRIYDEADITLIYRAILKSLPNFGGR